MILIILSFLGGVLTILSPCILPVLPFVFARADKPFLRSGLPLLLGMAVSFAAIASLATIGGGWAVHANQYGRIAAMILLALFGLTLLIPSLAERLTRPLVALGSRISGSAQTESMGGAALLGVATGLLWAPCAGPILGLILTSAAIKGASANTSILLLAYALGAGVSLGAALLIGGKLFAAMKQSLGPGEWIRRALGALVLAGVAAIALGLDTGFLTRVSVASTAGIEQFLVERTGLVAKTRSVAVAGSTLPVEGVMPELAGATLWLNSPPLTRAALKGKVVLVDFWTYSCINCLRSLPYIRAWAQKYKDHGLVVIGVHAPEFAFEKDEANVKGAVAMLGVRYPVAMDNDLTIWQAFHNQYWPAHYFMDAQGRIRAHHFGEGEYDKSEQIIQQLLTEAGYKDVPTGIVNPAANGAEAAADLNAMQSPETYLGYSRGENFAGTPARNEVGVYKAPAILDRNQWALDGKWIIGQQTATSINVGAAVSFRFHARDLHLVLGTEDKPVRFRITIDGKPPGDAHGQDTDAAGNGSVTVQRLYQLVRQSGPVRDRIFRIELLDPGVEAFAFTFG